jgi:hypothetical protein
MPPPKKAAKKAAGHRHDKRHEAKDLRRAYEHMGRVAVLRQTSNPSEQVAELTALAQQAIKDGHTKEAADLLRASEHLSFAVLAGEASGIVRVSAELKEAITEQFDDLTRKAQEHWQQQEEPSDIVAATYQSSRNSASKAFKANAFHQALEFARASEALAHVKQLGPLKLESGGTSPRLKSA